jgi:hypothetical protein
MKCKHYFVVDFTEKRCFDMKKQVVISRALFCGKACGFLIFAAMVFSGVILFPSCSSVKNIQLTSACKDALASNPNINHTKLVCNVKDGVAYLSGWVYTEKEKELAEEILRGVEGIIDVRNTIQIEEGGETNPVMLTF